MNRCQKQKLRLRVFSMADEGGFGLLEAAVGGALLLLAGFTLTRASTNSVTFEKRQDQFLLLNRILSNEAQNVMNDAAMFPPVNGLLDGNNAYIYYACFSKTGVMLVNSQDGSQDFGLASVPIPQGENAIFSSYDPVSIGFLKRNQVGFEEGSGGELRSPCSYDGSEEVGFVLHVLPLSVVQEGNSESPSNLVHLWVYILGGGGRIESGLHTTIATTPYL